MSDHDAHVRAYRETTVARVMAKLAECQERVSRNSAAFREMLPELLRDRRLVGRWVVVHDGQVKVVSDAQEQAGAAGRAWFGYFGGQAVHHVSVEANRPVSVPSFRVGP